MKLRELISDDASGNLSHSKLWSNIAYLSATVVFIKAGWSTAPGEGLVYLMLAYLGLVAGNQTASKFMSLKYGGKGNSEIASQVPTPVIGEGGKS